MKAENSPTLRLTNIKKMFGKLAAIDKVSLEVKAGEIYALIGPNGAGKTTLIKTIAGLFPPTEGVVNIGGFDVWQQPVEAKKLLGYIPDEPWAYPFLTAREFLEFTLKLKALDPQVTHERIKRLAHDYKIEQLLDGTLADFSRGNKQKIVIISALMSKPQLLIVDEPIVGLDTYSQQVTKKLFTDFAKDGGAVLVCTHTLPVVTAIADRIGILNQGKLITEGTLKQLKTEYPKLSHLEDIYLALTNGE